MNSTTQHSDVGLGLCDGFPYMHMEFSDLKESNFSTLVSILALVLLYEYHQLALLITQTLKLVRTNIYCCYKYIQNFVSMVRINPQYSWYGECHRHLNDTILRYAMYVNIKLFYYICSIYSHICFSLYHIIYVTHAHEMISVCFTKNHYFHGYPTSVRAV